MIASRNPSWASEITSFTPLSPRLTRLFKKADQNGSASAEEALAEFSELDDLYPAICTDEPDGHCPHGAPSLLLALGLIVLAGMPFLLPRVHDNSLLFASVTVLAAACLGAIALATLDRWPPRLIAAVPARIVQFAMLVRAPLLAAGGRAMLIVSAIVVHLITVATCYVLAIGLEAPLTALDAFVLVPLVILSSAVPISIGGWGVREGAMVAALGLAGIASDKALAISVLLGLGGLIVGLFGGLVWLIAPERTGFSPEEARAIAERTDAAPV